MANRNFKLQFDEVDWETLKLSLVLVCRDPSIPADNARYWSGLTAMLRHVGTQAAALHDDHDLALSVLADFAEESACLDVIARVRKLSGRLSEPALRAMTERAGALVDRRAPEQSFAFRATLVLVSMLVSESMSGSVVSGVASCSPKPLG